MAAIVNGRRWQKAAAVAEEVPPPPAPPAETEAAAGLRMRAARGVSYILQHYHSTGCAEGAFCWRAAMMDPEKQMTMCTEEREYRETTLEDIELSKSDKQRGGGPRVGPFQDVIPGASWQALPKYDFTTHKRSSAFNERMHVEWENHVDHILKNQGELPDASVVAKAGFRSCAPCCRDMLALAHPTGKTFIMVDLAEDDKRGTFHFVAGSQYLPVPKESCSETELAALKRIVNRAQDGGYSSSAEVVSAVTQTGAPIDETARSLYLGDQALMPEGCAIGLKGDALLQVLHAEHFARLSAEYGASIMRDGMRPPAQRAAILQCRERAKAMLAAAWAPHLAGVKVDLQRYVEAATSPLLPEDPREYEIVRRSSRVPRPAPALTAERLCGGRVGAVKAGAAPSKWKKRPAGQEDTMSVITTAVPDDEASQWSDTDSTAEP